MVADGWGAVGGEGGGGGWAAATTGAETSSCCYWCTRGEHEAKRMRAPDEGGVASPLRWSSDDAQRANHHLTVSHAVSRSGIRHRFHPKNTLVEDRLHGRGLAMLF